MKIKLNRDLWNHKKDETIDIEESRGNWAILNGHALPVEDKHINEQPTPAQNKAIELKYKRNKK